METKRETLDRERVACSVLGLMWPYDSRALDVLAGFPWDEKQLNKTLNNWLEEGYADTDGEKLWLTTKGSEHCQGVMRSHAKEIRHFLLGFPTAMYDKVVANYVPLTDVLVAE